MELRKEKAFNELQKLFRDKPFVLFGTGMSIAIDNVFGMNALREYLLSKMDDTGLNESQKKEWDSVRKSLDSGNDFEKAMNNVKDEELISKIA